MVKFLQNDKIMLQLLSNVQAKITVQEVKSSQLSKAQVFSGQGRIKSAVEEFEGWWAYEVDPNDGNYDDRTFDHLPCIFYDSDQNFQIETHYQMCVNGTLPFRKTQRITGDQNG